MTVRNSMLLQNPLTHEDCRLRDPVNLTGTVTKIGYYGDTIPKLIIALNKGNLYPCTIGYGVRHPAILTINGDRFYVGLRTTVRSATVMVCPDILDSGGRPARLADALFNLGIEATSRLSLSLEVRHSGIFIGVR